MSDNLWDEWTDVLGQTYRPGDFVAYAMISGRSPQLVFARVLQIRKTDSKGEEVREFAGYKDHPTETLPSGRPRQVQVFRPSAKVKVLPLQDARGFWRSKESRAVTLSIPNNIIKIEPRPEWTDEHHIAGLQELREELDGL